MNKNRIAQSISTYLMILFGISIVFYLGGYKPLMFTAFETEVGSNETIGTTFINGLAGIFTNPTFLALLGVSTVASFFLVGGAGAGITILPILFFLTTFGSMFILPSSFVFDTTLPSFLRIVIGVFLNLFLMLSILNFIQGR